MALSHLLHAVDVLLFTNGSTRSLHAVMGLLSSSSGQSVSLEKSAFYIEKKALHRATHIHHIIGIMQHDFPIRYLGAPIFAGRSKLIYFEHLVDKVRRKLEVWKAQLLNFAGKLTLIKSFLSSIPIYTLASTNVPLTTIKCIEQIMCNFLWSSRGEHRIHWICWESVCRPTDEGGLGIKRLSDIQNCLHGKLMWQVMQDNSLWGRFARAKYWRYNRVVDKSSSSPLWNSIATHEERLKGIGQWIIGRGDTSFWCNNWADEILNGPLPYSLNSPRGCPAS